MESKKKFVRNTEIPTTDWIFVGVSKVTSDDFQPHLWSSLGYERLALIILIDNEIGTEICHIQPGLLSNQGFSKELHWGVNMKSGLPPHFHTHNELYRFKSSIQRLIVEYREEV